MNLFKKKVRLDNLIMTNGRIMCKKTEHSRIYEVLDVAKNVNYQGISKKIEKGDRIICEEYLFHSSFEIDKTTYYIIRPKQILGVFP